MTSRRIQLGSFVRLRRKTSPLSVYGKVESEASKKLWNVLFYSKEKTEEKTSGQLSFVDKSELPREVAEWLGVLPSKAPSIVAESETPLIETEATDDLVEIPAETTTPLSELQDDNPGQALDSPFNFFDPTSPASANTTESGVSQTIRRQLNHGKSVTVKKKGRPVQEFIAGEKRALFPDEDSDTEDTDTEELLDDEEVEEDIILTAEERDTYDSLDDEAREKTTAYLRKRQKAAREKREFIREKKEVVVANGVKNPVLSRWRVIDDIDDAGTLTALRRPESEIGVIDLDFNKLAEADYPLVEVFLRFWPGDATKQLEKLNRSFQQRHKGNVPPVTLREFFVFFACILSASPAGYGGEKLWKPSKAKGIFPHPDLAGVMKLKRFTQIKKCFADAFAYDESDPPNDNWSPIDGKNPGNDEWRRLQGLINDFHETIKRNFAESDQKCLDEPMSPWKPRQSKTGNLPHISFIARKPKPLGTEFKSVACAVTGVMLHLEIQRGKFQMPKARHQSSLGATTGCTLRLGEATASPNDTLYGDSWFASVKTALEVKKNLRCHFIGHVKQAHRQYPKEWLEKTMEDWPGGTYIVLESCFSEDLIAVGYKYNARKVCMFIMTRGAELTSCGDPYVAKFLSDKGNYSTRKVDRPLVASTYFQISGSIDQNNQIRQGVLALEEHWKTIDGWFRCICTVLGIATTNAFFACNHSFSADSEYSKLKAKDFASILCHQLVDYPFPDSHSFGRNVVRPGQAPPQWFEMIPGRFNPNALPPIENVLGDITNQPVQPLPPPTIGKTVLKSGWEYSRIDTVCKPCRAPDIPVDIREVHKQVKMKIGIGDDNKRHRPPQCKMCFFYGLKQKRPPYLCVHCGDFFCHDIDLSTGSSFPRQCYWTHMCHEYRDSGLATAGWKSKFESWNKQRVENCKESDGIW